MIIHGDCEEVLQELQPGIAQLVITSPPYYNARAYSSWQSYDDYLAFMARVFCGIHRSLSDGRFFAINTSPVIVPRSKRSESSLRLGIPFDLHPLITAAGFEFVDDIVWVKPSGASAPRQKRFTKDRQPLQYKPMAVTEYIMVYRRKTDKLIDWNIRSYPDDVRAESRIDVYEKTNVWNINPARNKRHPAVYPDELAERLIRYYSYKGDTVLDPFGGSGTTGRVAQSLDRNYIMIESNQVYIDLMKDTLNGRLRLL